MVSDVEESDTSIVQERAGQVLCKRRKHNIYILSGGELREKLLTYCARASEISVLPITIVKRRINPLLKMVHYSEV
jgi:hypothetical protein